MHHTRGLYDLKNKRFVIWKQEFRAIINGKQFYVSIYRVTEFDHRLDTLVKVYIIFSETKILRKMEIVKKVSDQKDLNFGLTSSCGRDFMSIFCGSSIQNIGENVRILGDGSCLKFLKNNSRPKRPAQSVKFRVRPFFKKILGLNPVLVDPGELITRISSFFEIGHCLPLPLSNFR